jgi:hypothetical protein
MNDQIAPRELSAEMSIRPRIELFESGSTRCWPRPPASEQRTIDLDHDDLREFSFSGMQSSVHRRHDGDEDTTHAADACS